MTTTKLNIALTCFVSAPFVQQFVDAYFPKLIEMLSSLLN